MAVPNERCACGHGRFDHSMTGECLIVCAEACKQFRPTGEVIAKMHHLTREEHMKNAVEAADAYAKGHPDEPSDDSEKPPDESTSEGTS